MEKYCSKCGELKLISEFYLRKDTNKPYSACKTCHQKHKQNNKSKYEWYLKNRDRVISTNKVKRKNNPKANMLATAKHRAKKNDLPFSITVDDFDIPEYCPILKIKLEVNDGIALNNSPSLDKIIPELGYVVGNIQVISKLANSMKTNASVEELMLFAEWVFNNFKENDD